MSVSITNRGFTLMEIAIVLAIISILVVVLTPVFTTYLDRARISRAQLDLQHIAAAVIQFHTDTNKWPVYSAGWDGNPSHAADAMSGPGDNAVSGGLATWTLTTVGSLVDVMNTNSLTLSTTGMHAWKGPYTALDSDPWGTKYYLTSKNFVPGSTKVGYVLSAGPNQQIDTEYEQERAGTFTIGGDDLVVAIK